MKFNKLLLALSASMVLGLAGCDNGPTQTDEGRAAALEAVANMTIAINNKTATKIFPKGSTVANKLSAGTNINLEKARQWKEKATNLTYDVELTWGYDQAKYGTPGSEGGTTKSNTVYRWQDDNNDPTKLFVSFTYSATEEKTFEFFVDMKCGEVTKHLDYELTLLKLDTDYDDYTIAELYETAEGSKGTYYKNWQGEDRVSKYKSESLNVRSKGQAVYCAPDGNFGIVGDGAHFLYLYKVKEAGFTLEVGKYYEFGGEMTSYKGSVQLSFMTLCNELGDGEHDDVAPAAKWAKVKAENLQKYTSEEATPNAWKHFSDKHASLVELRAKLTTPITNASDTSRYTVKIKDQPGNVEFTLAYDYHTAIGKALAEKLNGLIDEYIIIRGFTTYNTSSNDEWGETGSWQVVPYDLEQIFKDEVN